MDNEVEDVPASVEELAALAGYRSRIYGFLGAVFNRLPDDHFAASLQGEDQAGFFASLAEIEDLPSGMREGLRFINSYSRAAAGRPLEEVRTELAVERTRLVRGIKRGYGPPPPYESVYLSPDEQPEMRATVAVLRAYAGGGAAVPETGRDQPDFIGFELDFMRHLADKEAQAWQSGDSETALGMLHQELAFLRQHINAWVPLYCNRMADDAQLDFYRGIALMTAAHVLDDAQKVAELSEWAPAASA